MKNPIISSLLETDLYKFTMLQAMLHHYPANSATYRFVCRNATAFPLVDLIDDINEQLDALCTLRFTRDELDYLSQLRFFKPDFIEFLRVFQFNRQFIHVSNDQGTLSITAQGPQIHIMGFEIYVLAIVNELYFQRLNTSPETFTEGRIRLEGKIKQLRAFESPRPAWAHRFEFFDFGLRRRFSSAWHDEVVRTLQSEAGDWFKGTSNVFLARKYNLTPIGTMAHEWLQTFQGVGVQLKNFQKAALETWVQEYRGDLGIALTDVVGFDAFLRDFDLFYAKLFDGLRHDSGDPVQWGEKAIAHYKKLRIEPSTKRLTFSDGLTVESALSIFKHFEGRAQLGFGIGTSLTNDLGPKPLNIVMKLVQCNEQPVAKLADSPGKTLCEDTTFLNYLRQVFNQ